MWDKWGEEKLKIFLVEDEVLIREGIQNGVAWEKEGFEFAGAASDGELAYPMILDTRPDILVTDIKMPFMDGLELSRLVKRELPDIKILILSGYDDFALAKEAIEIGVTEYLLKPVSMAGFLKALNKVAAMVGKEKDEKKLLQKYSVDMKEKTEYEKTKFFMQMMSGTMPLSRILESGKRFGMNLSARSYNVILFHILAGAEHQAETERTLEAGERIERFVHKIPYIFEFRKAEGGWAFLLTAEDERQMEEHTAEFRKGTERIMSDFRDLTYFGGTGEPVSRLREIRTSYMEAEMAFAGRFTCKSNQIVSVRELQEMNEETGFEVNSYEHIGNFRNTVEKFLNNGMREEIGGFAESYTGGIQEKNFRSNLLRQYMVMDIYVTVMAFVEKLNAEDSSGKEEAFREEMQTIRTVKDMQNFMKEMLDWALELRDEVSGKHYLDVIHAAKEMIEQSYMTENISLSTVAAGVGMSASYFSYIFSREVGMTFVECLTETRMEKAKELLMCSSMKTSEIGFEVGYRDPHYFSYIFKKTQGYSPKEYRARKKELENARNAG